MLSSIIKYRDLLFLLTLRDIKIRYKQAMMGFMWAIFMPILATMAGLFVKKVMATVSGRYLEMTDAISICAKVLPWTFFVSSIKFAVNSLVGNRDLLTKIYFPREVFPLASILACLFDLFIATIALSLVFVFAHISIDIHILWLPLLLIFLIMFTTGFGLFVAALNLFYRDVKYIVEIILMFGIFFTPVFYAAQEFGKYKTLMLLNPVGSILESINNTLVLHQMPEPFWIFYAGAASILMLIAGLIIFHKTEPYFAENI